MLKVPRPAGTTPEFVAQAPARSAEASTVGRIAVLRGRILSGSIDGADEGPVACAGSSFAA
jgi:hypothetical protein